jgi:hypothetical protein
MIKKLFELLITFLLVSGPVYSQSAEDIIEKVFDARGRGKRIDSINTLKIRGKMSYNRVTGTFVVYNKKPFLNRFEFELMDKRVIQTINATGGWYINEISNQYDAQSMTNDVYEKSKYQNYYPMHPLYNYKEKGINLEFEGKDSVAGKECYVIKEIMPDSSSTEMYVDIVDYLQLLQRTKIKQPGAGDVVIETYYKDYKNVGGLMIPYFMEQKNNGETQTKMLIEKADVNVHIDDSVFEVPSTNNSRNGEMK